MAEWSLNGLKTQCGKEELLVSSNFSFSHSVFKRLVLQTRKNQGLFGKGLIFCPISKIQQLHDALDQSILKALNFEDDKLKASDY